MWIGPLKFTKINQNTDGASRLALILNELSLRDCDITVVGQMACKAVTRMSKSASACNMIENASVVWEFLKGRNLPGVMALDRAFPFSMNWKAIYSDPAHPVWIDIGSGNGLFLTGMAMMREDLNFLGLEINEKLVRRCLDSVHQAGLKNLHFIATNATSMFRTIVSSYPGPVVLVSIQCPNPDFNEPEHRWRMIQRLLIEAIADLLTSGGKVFLQSDVEEVAVRMKDQFLKEGKGKLSLLQDDGGDGVLGSTGWLKENPFGVESDWERHVIARGAPMYRLMLYKT